MNGRHGPWEMEKLFEFHLTSSIIIEVVSWVIKKGEEEEEEEEEQEEEER